MINVGATPSRDDSITFGVSQSLNNAGTYAEMYSFAKGARCDSATISCEAQGLVTVESEWVPNDVTTWSSTSGITGTPVWTPLNSATHIPFSSISGGATPVLFNSIAQKCKSYSITVNNAIDENQFIGSATVESAQPTTYRGTFELDIVYTDTTLIADTKSYTKRPIVLAIGTGATITMADCWIETYDEPLAADSTDAKTVTYSGKFREAVIS